MTLRIIRAPRPNGLSQSFVMIARRYCAAGATSSGATGSTAAAPAPTEEPKGKRTITVFSNVTKGVYLHQQNRIASWYWFITDFHKWFIFACVTFVGSLVLSRYRVATSTTAAQAQIGENLLDQRTRDLLSDVEQLRLKDPVRLENEANAFHEAFWKRRAVAVANERQQQRTAEMKRGLLQGEARGTDMTEWLGAKHKDDEEREVARRTHDYIQGFHQHLKAKRLI